VLKTKTQSVVANTQMTKKACLFRWWAKTKKEGFVRESKEHKTTQHTRCVAGARRSLISLHYYILYSFFLSYKIL